RPRARRPPAHPPDRLTVGLHAIGFLADTTDEAAEIFFPGYAHTFTEIGKERGWPAATRAQFDAQRGPTGALLIGDAKTVAKKIGRASCRERVWRTVVGERRLRR